MCMRSISNISDCCKAFWPGRSIASAAPIKYLDWISRMTIAAPSPRTKPLRNRSIGRDALVGSSLLVESAVSRLKPVTPKGWIML